MEIWCVIDPDEIPVKSPDIIVFPEDTPWESFEKAQASHPKSIIAGAKVDEENRCQGILLHQGANRIDYWKIGRDGRSIGGGWPSRPPIYVMGELVIGLVICMDFQLEGKGSHFCSNLCTEINRRPGKYKILCVPCDLGTILFERDQIDLPEAKGIHIAMCNNVKSYDVGPGRRASFITDCEGKKIRKQSGCEPIPLSL